MHRFILQYKKAPGDTLVLSALVRDLKAVYKQDIQIGIRCSYPDIWQGNPYITHEPKNATLVNMSEGFYIRKSREGVRQHFITAFFRDFTEKTKVPIWPLLPHGDLHLTDYEKTHPIIRGNYWVIVPGGKTDATVKIWPTSSYQEVVNQGAAHNWHFVQEGAAKPKHIHPPLVGPLSMVGRTTIRDLIVNIYHSQGVICGITLPMHIAAALNKPCVVLAGGREEPWWEHYDNAIQGQFGPDCAPVKVPHRFLNTFGQLDCCETRGCWRQRVVRLRDGHAKYEKSLCSYPEIVPGEPIARCMTMIKPEHVLNAIGSYAGDWAPAPPPVVVRSPTLQATNRDKPVAPQVLHAVTTPTIAGSTEMTCCILMYGDSPADYAKHQQCLDSIVATTPTGALDFRIGCNQIGAQTRAYLRERVPNAVLYEDTQQRRKYPAMREMFHDPRHPLTTGWVLWFDDDTYAIDAHWYAKLKDAQGRAAENVGALGWPMYSTIPPDRLQWFRDATWFRGVPFRTKFGRAAPNGNCVHFPVGWFWAVRREAIQQCDIPCSRLNHNGGDVTIGEQLYQNGFRVSPFNVKKAHIFTPPKSRRGYSEQPPWSHR